MERRLAHPLISPSVVHRADQLRLVCPVGLHFDPLRQSLIAGSDSARHLPGVRVLAGFGSGQDFPGTFSEVSSKQKKLGIWHRVILKKSDHNYLTPDSTRRANHHRPAVRRGCYAAGIDGHSSNSTFHRRRAGHQKHRLAGAPALFFPLATHYSIRGRQSY